jgi:hypothetical protein
MLLRLRTNILRGQLPLRAGQTPQIRLFCFTPIRSLKEDGDRSPQELEDKKQEQISKQKRGEGEWHESLASSGESNVKADQEKVHDHEDHMENLQEKTANKAEKGKI